MSKINLRSTSDGWRGKIADSFTFNFVERVAVAIGSYILKHGGTETFVGYDSRFLGFEFARRAGQVLSQFGLNVFISSRPIPTPMISFRTNQKEMVCGITITASHNPYYYNGVKVRMDYGGAPDEEFVMEVQDLMDTPRNTIFQEGLDFQKDDPIEDYCQKLRTLIDWQSFNRRPLKVTVDTMHGTTSGVLRNVLSGTKTEVSEIHGDFDPYFGGVAPEPMECNTQELQRIVKDPIFRTVSRQGLSSQREGCFLFVGKKSRWHLEPRMDTGVVVRPDSEIDFSHQFTQRLKPVRIP